MTHVINVLRGRHMKKITPYLLKQYKHMSGDKKVRIAMKLSQLVRIVRQAGVRATGV